MFPVAVTSSPNVVVIRRSVRRDQGTCREVPWTTSKKREILGAHIFVFGTLRRPLVVSLSVVKLSGPDSEPSHDFVDTHSKRP